MCPDHDGNKLEINSRMIIGRHTNTWTLSNTNLNNPWMKKEVSRRIKITLN